MTPRRFRTAISSVCGLILVVSTIAGQEPSTNTQSQKSSSAKLDDVLKDLEKDLGKDLTRFSKSTVPGPPELKNETLEYQRAALKYNLRLYEWQLSSAKIVFWVVIIIIAVGLLLAI